MLKLNMKTNAFMEALEDEMATYEDELQEDGYIEIERFSGFQAKKGFDYDVIVRIYEEADSEVQNIHYFSYTTEQEKDAQKRIDEIKTLIEEKEYKIEETFR